MAAIALIVIVVILCAVGIIPVHDLPLGSNPAIVIPLAVIFVIVVGVAYRFRNHQPKQGGKDS